MCGITGFIEPKQGQPAESLEATALRMAKAIRSRGPDDQGAWADPARGVALGFRRLAILDLSPTGHQPMFSEDGRYVIIFNGEIYNYATLRGELAQTGCAFRGTSDTEVILAGIVRWGLTATIERLNGMFAFALWDKAEQALYLVRDRLGIKPLYYGWCGSTFLFGSELKALREHPNFQAEVDRGALALYLRHNCVPAPYSIYRGISKLLPGSFLRIRPDEPDAECRPQVYWSARETVETGTAHPYTGSPEDAVEELDALLRESIRERMVADVPLGAFLSGGIDSSLVTAVMQSQSERPVRTFTIGFWEPEFDEAGAARAVAKHLGTDHTELYVTAQQALDAIPRLPQLYDEPFSDSSQIPSFLVSAMARQHVIVALSGDGGDEMFAGYNRYTWVEKLWKRLKPVPLPLRSAAKGVMNCFSPGEGGGRRWSEKLHLPLFNDKYAKLAGVLDARDPADIYTRLVSHWQNPTALTLGAAEPATILTDPARWAKLDDFTLQMMYLDLVTYLPDDILAKVDRATMGTSLESRAPFLDDTRVVEFAWRLPLDFKLRDGRGKWILRQVLAKYLPVEAFERPKMGFTMPIGAWLRGPLREWAEDLLAEDRLRREGYFDPAPIRRTWNNHLAGRPGEQYRLWDILMFQAWLNETHE
jgi:asparagine synthase (glutamine-hydrolysing)